MKAIVMSRAGGTEVLEMVDRPDPIPGPGGALVEVVAAGVNFMDTAVRRGQFEGLDARFTQADRRPDDACKLALGDALDQDRLIEGC